MENSGRGQAEKEGEAVVLNPKLRLLDHRWGHRRDGRSPSSFTRIAVGFVGHRWSAAVAICCLGRGMDDTQPRKE
jgi:hypothetical protein